MCIRDRKSPLSELKHDEILDVLQLTSEQVVIEDIKSLKLNQTYLSEINDLGFKVNRPGMPSLSLDDVQTLPDLEEIDGDRDKLISCQSIIDGTKRRVITVSYTHLCTDV